jgi:hypothetical protein
VPWMEYSWIGLSELHFRCWRQWQGPQHGRSHRNGVSVTLLPGSSHDSAPKSRCNEFVGYDACEMNINNQQIPAAAGYRAEAVGLLDNRCNWDLEIDVV